MTEVNVLATTDVHGFINDEGNSHTLSFKNLKDEYPNSLLIDNGDFFIGNPLTSYFCSEIQVSPLVKFANDVKYDVMVPGNHDFDHGLDYLKRQVEALNADYVCCNVYYNNDQRVFRPYVVKEIDGVKVGVVGVLTSGMSMISDYQIMKDLMVKDAFSELEKIVLELRPQVDLLIVAYHGGIENDLDTGRSTTYATGEDQTYKLVSKIDGIDGFICGHQHWINHGIVNSTGVIQCGYAGNCYGHLKFDTSLSKCEIVNSSNLKKSEGNYYDSNAYKNWLESKFDVRKLAKFLDIKYNRKNLGIFLDLKGATKRELIDSFTIPYGVRIYHLNKEEYEHFAQKNWNIKEENQSQSAEDYLVLTNSYNVPDYRLEEQFVDNIFDQFLYYQQLMGD